MSIAFFLQKSIYGVRHLNCRGCSVSFPDHMPNPETRDHFNEGIGPEAEESDCSVFVPKEY